MTNSRSAFLLCALLILSLSPLFAAENEIRSALQPLVDSGEMPGFVTIVATKDKIVQIDTIGYADVEAKKPMKEDTIFWIASTSKPIAAAALMILVDEGKVDLDAPIANYLSDYGDFANQKVAVKNDDGTVLLKKPNALPTVRQALSHTSGFAFFSPFMVKYGIDSLPPTKLATVVSMMNFDDEPGDGYNYSNVGIDLTSAIVEKVSGMSFDEFLSKRIFQPLGMNTTFFVPTNEQVERIAKSYGFGKEKNRIGVMEISQLTYPLDGANRFPEAGGGLFSTASDTLRFFQMLARGGELDGRRILSEAAVEEMTKKQTGNRPESYGLGMGVNGIDFGHGGAHGNDAYVENSTGMIRIYMVQVAGVPKQGEAKTRFDQAAAKVFQNP